MNKELKKRIFSSLVLIPITLFFIIKVVIFLIFLFWYVYVFQFMNGTICQKIKIIKSQEYLF